MTKVPIRSSKSLPDEVQAHDVCQTPPHAVEPLLPLLRELNPNKDRVIWEPACGPNRHIERALQVHGYTVRGTDLQYGDNALKMAPKQGEIVITNPPWSAKFEWLRWVCAFENPWALLLPFMSTFAKDFHRILADYSIDPRDIAIVAPSRRYRYQMPNRGWKDSRPFAPSVWVTHRMQPERRYLPSFTVYHVDTRDWIPYEDGVDAVDQYRDVVQTEGEYEI